MYQRVAVRRANLTSLDGMFPLTLAGRLRATFDEVLSTSLPESLAVLIKRLGADGEIREARRDSMSDIGRGPAPNGETGFPQSRPDTVIEALASTV